MHTTLHTEELTQFINKLYAPYLKAVLADLREFTEKYKAGSDLGHEFLVDQQNFQAQAYQLITESVEIAVETGLRVPYLIADDFCSYLQSLDRGILLIKLQQGMSVDDWAKLFVEHWTSIETADYIDLVELKRAVNRVGMPLLRKYMTEEDREQYDNLPDVITVYRGCANQGDGLSWTLRKEVAEQFVLRKEGAYKGGMKLRLIVSTQDQGLREDLSSAQPKPVGLYLGEVSKEDCIVFFNRNEQEIFSTSVKVLKACN